MNLILPQKRILNFFSLRPTIIDQHQRLRKYKHGTFTRLTIVGTIIISPNGMSVIRPGRELHHYSPLAGQAWFYSTGSVKWPGHTYRPRKILYSASDQTQRHFSRSFTSPPGFILLVRPDVAHSSVQIIHPSLSAGRTASSIHLFHVLIKVLLPTCSPGNGIWV